MKVTLKIFSLGLLAFLAVVFAIEIGLVAWLGMIP